jgi:hypothetical protein
MASVSTSIEAISLTSAVSQAMTRVYESLKTEQKEKLAQWIEDIEAASEEKVRKITPNQMKNRKPEAIAAAALYDAFIQFESRTEVKIGLNELQEALCQSACSINTAWKRLYDNRVYLRGEFLDVVYSEKEGTITDAISRVIHTLRRAVETSNQEVTTWLAEIENEAIDLSETIPRGVIDKYDSLLIAITSIYTAARQYHGKMIVPIGQRDLSLLGATSPATICKCRSEFFGK